MITKSIDYTLCTSCMECERICTNSRVLSKNEKGQPFFKNDQRCIYCGHCLAVCPQGAIRFTPALPRDAAQTCYAETVKRNPEARYDPEQAFDLLCGIRSARLFLDKPVEQEKLKKVLEAMVRAPSAGNEQNRKYYIIRDPAKIGEIENALWAYFNRTTAMYHNPVFLGLFSLLGAVKAGKSKEGSPEIATLPLKTRREMIKSMLKEGLPDRNSAFSYMKRAPALIVVTQDRKGGALHKDFYKGDACIAVTCGTVMAKALGLSSCWMGLLEIAANKDPKIRALIGLAEKERIAAACVFGYSDTRWYRIPPRGPANTVWL